MMTTKRELKRQFLCILIISISCLVCDRRLVKESSFHSLPLGVSKGVAADLFFLQLPEKDYSLVGLVSFRVSPAVVSQGTHRSHPLAYYTRSGLAYRRLLGSGNQEMESLFRKSFSAFM